ncbi:hypothetical protein D3C86_1784320 [compost metagenome]
MVFSEKTDVRLQNMQIRERGNAVVEIDRVVPKKNVGADFSPIFHVFFEIRTFRVGFD